MVALGFAVKQLIRWDKDGRRTHVFNPSSFPLAVFSLGLILTGKSDLTWGQDIASTQFYPLIDRLARSKTLRALDPAALGRSLVPRHRNLAYMSIWTIVFAVMSAVRGVGDSHPGQWLPFWRQACNDERPYACPYLEDLLSSFCGRGSHWACNERGFLQAQGLLDRASAVESVRLKPDATDYAQPTLDDYPIILRGSKGPIAERTPEALYALACREGWPDTCGRASGQ